jgi:predicted nucleic acid-binding protein
MDLWQPDRSVSLEQFVQGAIGRLHRGELEAMVIALEQGIDLVVMDDLLARRKAVRLGLRPIGTVGVLLIARKRGLISAEEVISALDELVEIHGIYLSESTREKLRDELRP